MEPTAIAQACAYYLDELDSLLVTLEARFNPATRTIEVFAEGPDDDEMHERILEVYFDFPFHLPMAPPEVDRYRLELVTTDDGEPRHRYVLESSVEQLPDTGGSSQARWASFLSQFTYTLDGVPQAFPMPEDFPEA